MTNFMPFVEWIDDPTKGFYVRNTWDFEKQKWGGVGRLGLFPHQRRILEHILTPNEDGEFPYETIIYACPKKSGKALALDTPIATPTGWTTMGELQEGDKVFDEQGQVCTVTFATEVMHDHPCYEVLFSNGERIVADAEHLWYVGSRKSLPGVEQGEGGLYWGVVTTADLQANLRHSTANNFLIPAAKPLQLEESYLPIPPYTMGAWLGDGDRNTGRMVVAEGEEQILDLIEAEGVSTHSVKTKDRTPTYRLGEQLRGQKGGITSHLRRLGVQCNKHIHRMYLRASYEQRLALLRGLMDTDGYVSKDGRCEFTSISRELADGFRELLATLGIKSRVTEGVATLNGRIISPKYRVHFQSYRDVPVFGLDRKVDRLIERTRSLARSEKVIVVGVNPVPSVPVRCITVDSPNHLYLAGRTLIPTHNTAISAAVAAWYADQAEPGTEIYAIANDQDQSEGLVMADIRFHADYAGYRKIKYKIELPNSTFIQALAQSYKSISGSRHALTLWDELWGYVSESSRRAWDEMTPIPTVPTSMRWISTYAGFQNESDLLWELYLQGVGKDEHEHGQGEPVPGLEDLPCYRNGRLFVYWEHDGRMPWQTETYYNEQLKSLRPAAFLRLHTNQWTTSHEAFIPVEWWELAAEKYHSPANLWTEHPYARYPVHVGLDAGVKRDCSAVVGVTYDPKLGKVIQLFHKIWTPRSDEEFDLEATVEYFLKQMALRFNIAAVFYDPTHLHQTVTNLKRAGLPMIEYSQTQQNMTNASQILFDLLKFKNLWAYPDEEMKKHIQMAVAEEHGRGFRIVKKKNARNPIDAAIALAMASFSAVKAGGVDTSKPIVITSPFSDVTRLRKPDDLQRHLPFPLRTDI